MAAHGWNVQIVRPHSDRGATLFIHDDGRLRRLRLRPVHDQSSKITRDAFLYLEEGDNEDLGQCVVCQLWVEEKALGGQIKGDRCFIHGPHKRVKGGWSCALYIKWPDDKPIDEIIRVHAMELRRGCGASVTAEQSGLVPRRVQCHRCKYTDADAVVCGLFKKLNEALPDYFDLDPNIKPNGCCNAQLPRPAADQAGRHRVTGSKISLIAGPPRRSVLV